MNHDYEQTEFSKSVLAGVFAGIAATILSMVFNAYFRAMIEFSLSEIINVSTIIFISILATTLSGIMFYLLHHYLKKGTVIFQLLSVVFTAILIVGVMYIQRSSDPMVSNKFRELLIGIIGITSLCTIFLVPFLFRHDYL